MVVEFIVVHYNLRTQSGLYTWDFMGSPPEETVAHPFLECKREV
jgi:hypothetical protein